MRQDLSAEVDVASDAEFDGPIQQRDQMRELWRRTRTRQVVVLLDGREMEVIVWLQQPPFIRYPVDQHVD